MGKEKTLLVGFDLGGTKMMAGLLDDKFNVLARERKRTRAKDGESDDTFARMVELIEELLKNNGKTRDDLAGIGVGSPGPLNLTTGVIGETPNLGWDNFPLRDKMAKALGVPVVVGNDVDLGTLGEYHFGAARKGRTILGVFPGTGIGGAVIVDGKLLTGVGGSVGEIGHVPLDPNGPRCGCGRRGCLEAYAGRWAIAARAWVAAMRGDAPALVAEAGLDPNEYRSKALAKSISSGDKAIAEIVRDAARQIGQVIGGLVNVLGPDVIVMGGGLVEAMPELFVDEAAAMIKQIAIPALGAATRVVAAKLGDDAVMMGAARSLADQLESKK